MTLALVVPDRSRLMPSGGDRYNAAVVEHWRRRRTPVRVHVVPGAWPDPTPQDLERLATVLQGVAGHGAGGSGAGGDGAHGGGDAECGVVLLDGLVGSAAPEVVLACAALRPTAILVHSLLSDGASASGERAREMDEREGRALAAAHAVIVTSDWARREVERRYGLVAAVAEPGVDPSPVAPGSGDTPQLLTLASLTPLKNHALLLAALETVAHHRWTAVFAGPAPNPDLASALRADALRRGLADRITWPGPLLGQELDRTWSATDLLVHPSRSETYGLVVSEAHARGIPTIVGAGTGAEQTLRGDQLRGGLQEEGRDSTGALPGGGPDSATALPGAAVDTEDPAELGPTLSQWLTDAELRAQWRRAALRRRDELRGWDHTVDLLADALDAITDTPQQWR